MDLGIKHIYLYDEVIDLVTNKRGIIVLISEGNINKNIPEEYLFEPHDQSFFPDFRKFYQLKKVEK